MVLTKKQISLFLLCTFIATFFLHGVLAILTNFDIVEFNSPFGMLIYVFGTLSPTITAYIVLKKYKLIAGIKSFLKIIFSFKAKPIFYVISVFLLFSQFAYALTLNVDTGWAWYMGITMFILCIFDGGLEEVGWRYLLQPTLEKKHSFFIATIITAVIWFLWHIPHFFIVGSGQDEMNFLMFFMVILSGSFALAAIYYVSKNVWLCIMVHAAYNTGTFIFPITKDFVTISISTACSIIASSVIVFFYTKFKGSNNELN